MSEEMSISDLLPLVAAALNDQAAADASRELATAREERDRSRRVEVLRSINNGKGEDEDGETIVYGSALFEDGQYSSNTNLWEVKLEQNNSNSCRLADLRNCHICVGGGFPVATLDDTLEHNANFQGFVDGEVNGEEDTVDTCEVSFCFSPHSTWLTIWIQGWPRDEWEAFIQANENHPDDINDFLVNDVADQYPEATVEFKSVTFVAKSIHGALKRLLPPKRKEEVRADRDSRNAEQDPERDALYEFVGRAMRERGNEAHYSIFIPQVYTILGLLSSVGINRLGVNDEMIIKIVDVHERLGIERLRELFNQSGSDQVEESENQEEGDAENEEDEDV